MSFSQIYSQGKKIVSLEFFPPKSPEQMDGTLQTIQRLSELKPDFMTVTYGAGGGTRELTLQILTFINEQFDIPAVAHLTCVGHSESELTRIVEKLFDNGIRYILALRGDPPHGQGKFEKHPQGFANAMELSSFLKSHNKFSIAVAGYPEGHQEAVSLDADVDYLKRKVDAGAELVFTQLFFDTDMYFDFLEKTQAAGIKVPIVPGIMPIRNFGQTKRFTAMCGASIPENIMKELLAREKDATAVMDFGTEHALNMCRELLAGGAPGIHFYTLNKSKQVERIFAELDLST